MNHPEAKIQAEIVQWLQEHKFLFCSIPNEAAGKDAAIRMSHLKTLGLKSGAPDLLVFTAKGLICLEVKSSTGVQSPSQINFQSRLEELGYKYFVVRSVSEVEKIVNQC